MRCDRIMVIFSFLFFFTCLYFIIFLQWIFVIRREKVNKSFHKR